MKKEELEKEYGKELINKIFNGGYLAGCTIAIIDGIEDIPESDIRLAIKKMKGEPIHNWEWD